MNIIKHGTPKPPREDMISECDACGCVFTFSSSECKEMSSNNGGGCLYWMRCPCCDAHCTFDTGYPRDNDEDRAMDQRLKEKQSKLWELAASKL